MCITIYLITHSKIRVVSVKGDMIMKKMMRFILPASFLLLTAGCAPAESGGGEPDYEETKKMVVDILKTDDGKKAIQEVKIGRASCRERV